MKIEPRKSGIIQYQISLMYYRDLIQDLEYTHKLAKSYGGCTDVEIDGQWYILILRYDKDNQH